MDCHPKEEGEKAEPIWPEFSPIIVPCLPFQSLLQYFVKIILCVRLDERLLLVWVGELRDEAPIKSTSTGVLP